MNFLFIAATFKGAAKYIKGKHAEYIKLGRGDTKAVQKFVDYITTDLEAYANTLELSEKMDEEYKHDYE